MNDRVFQVPTSSYRARLGLLFGLLRRGRRRMVVVVLIMTAVTTVAGAVQAIGLRSIVDRAAAGDVDAVTIAAIVTAFAIGFGGIAGRVVTDLQILLGEDIGMQVDRDTFDVTAQMPGIEHLERPRVLDQVAVLRTSGRDVATAVFSVLGVVSLVFSIAIGVLLLVSVDPVLVFVPLFAIPAAVLAPRARHVVEQASTDAAEAQRVAFHLHELFVRPTSAMELRVFGAADGVDRRADAAWDSAIHTKLRGSLRSSSISGIGYVVLAIGYIGALALVTLRASNGDATPGDVILVAQITLMLRGSIGQVANAASAAAGAMRTSDRYLWLQSLAREQAEQFSGVDEPPQRLDHGIEFEHVTFRYPGTDHDVLTDVSLTIPAGSIVALVGANGAGKSTLVKLLCGLYLVDSGRITVDGVDLRSLDPAAWRSRITGSFQDHLKLEVAARQSIGAGLPEHLDADEPVLAAVDRAGSGALVATLRDGLDTHLGKTYRDGAELSGGQWQRVAITRGMMQDDALCVILDEPTASLDPAAEHELYERVTEQARVAAERDGGVTVLVSHRFSTVSMADLIFAFDQGDLVEAGTHDELMSRHGLYARMYEQQANAYRDEQGEPFLE